MFSNPEMVIVGWIVLVIIACFYKKDSLVCDRLENKCYLETRSLFGTKVTHQFPMDELEGAFIHCDETYQILISLKNQSRTFPLSEIGLGPGYLDSLTVKAQEINRFIKNTEQQKLEVFQDHRLCAILFILFIIAFFLSPKLNPY